MFFVPIFFLFLNDELCLGMFYKRLLIITKIVNKGRKITLSTFIATEKSPLSPTQNITNIINITL